MSQYVLHPIGVIHSPFAEPAGTPIQPRFAAGAAGTVEVFGDYAQGLADLEGFDRVWLVYWFHRAPAARLLVQPFLDGAQRGLFATRAPCRPNPVGISPVRLVRVEGNVLHVADLDVVDGTPLLDIKPYAPQFDCFGDARAGWLDRAGDDRPITADRRFDQDPPQHER